MSKLGKVIGVAFMGQTYKKMFSKIDQKFGSKAMPHKRKYTKAMRVFENRHLVPSQAGIFSNKMQATLDKQTSNVGRPQQNIGQASGLAIRQKSSRRSITRSKPRGKARAQARSKRRSFAK